MFRIRKSLVLSLVLAAALALPAAADHHLSGYLADLAGDFDYSNGRIVELAKAIPADKYGWRPGEGVRSVSEVLVHVAGANFYFANQFGVARPEEYGQDAEQKVTEKGAVLEMLEKSQKAMHEAIENATKKDLDSKVEMFGRERSWRSILMIVAGHGHEHLGQMIAYARSNGIAPPWSSQGDG